METKFKILKNEIVAETVFTHYINKNMEIKSKPSYQATYYENVLHIGCDKDYTDVFKCWNKDPNCFVIYFGTKGDEFN